MAARAKPERRRRRSGWRKGLRIAGWALLWLVAIVVAGAAIALVWINTEAGEDWVRRRAVAEARNSVPGLSIGELDGFLPFNFELQQVRIDEPDGETAVHVDRVYADVVLRALLSRTIELDELHIDRPRVRAVQDAQGRLNLAQLVEPPPEEERERWDLVVRDLRVGDGRIDAIAVENGARTAAIRNLSLRARARYVEQDWLATLSDTRFDYRVEGARGAVRARGRGELTDERMDVDLAAGVTGLFGPPEPTPIVVTAHGPPDAIDARLRVGADPEPLLRAAATVDVPGEAYDVQAVVEGLDPHALQSDWPEGDVRLAMQASGRGTPLQPESHADLRITSPGFELAGTEVQSVRVSLQTRDRHWRLDELNVRSLGATLRADGRGTRETFRLSARLDAERLGPLQVGGNPFEMRGQAALDVRPAAEAGLRVEGSTEIERLRFAEHRLDNLVTELDARLQPARRVGEAELRTREPLRINTIRIDSARTEAQMARDALRLQGEVALAGRQDGALEPGRFMARLPLERAEGGAVALARDAPLDAQLRWPGVAVTALMALATVETEQPVGGRLWVDARVGGTLEAPQTTTHVTLRRGQYGELRDVTARLRARADPQRSNTRLRAWIGGHHTLTLDAAVRAGLDALQGDRPRWTHVPFQLEAEVPTTAARRLAPVVPALGDVDGRMNATLSARGTVVDPELELTGRVHSAARRDRPAIRAATRVEGEVRDGRTHVRARTRLGRGQLVRLSASSSVTPFDVVRGQEQPPGHLRAEGAIGPFSLAQLGAIYTPLGDLGGRAVGRFELEGRPSRLEGSAELRGEQLRVVERPVGRLRADIELTRKRGRLAVRLRQRDGAASFAARIDDDGATSAELMAHDLDISAVRRLMRAGPVAEDSVNGIVLAQGHVAARGDRNANPAPVAPAGRLLDPARIVGDVKVQNLSLALFLNRDTEPRREPPEPEPARLDERLRQAVPFHLRRFEIVQGNIKLIDETLRNQPALELADVALTIENVASRRPFMNGAPAVMTFRGSVEKTGTASAFVTFDPLSERLIASGHATLLELPLASLNEFVRPMMDAQFTGGSLSTYASFRIDGNDISGGIKPVVESPEIEPAEDAPWFRRLFIEAGDLLTDVLADSRRGRDAIATVIPIQGELTDPEVQLVPTLLGVVRNAFVVGISSSFAQLPPATARQPQSIFQQAVDALTPEDPPEAQPENGE